MNVKMTLEKGYQCLDNFAFLDISCFYKVFMLGFYAGRQNLVGSEMKDLVFASVRQFAASGSCVITQYVRNIALFEIHLLIIIIKTKVLAT